MSINMDKMREKLAEARGEKKKSEKDKSRFKPEEGEAKIRFLPTEDGDPFKEFFVHYNIEKHSPLLCPKRNYNEECSICDFAFHLWREAVESDSEDQKKEARKYFAKPRYFSPIVVREQEEEEGPKVYSYGVTSYKEILELCLNEEFGDITDVDGGIDFTLKYEKAKSKEAFPKTTLTPSRKSSPLASSKKLMGQILNAIPDLESFAGKKVTSEETKQILDEIMDDPFAENKYNKKGGDEALSVDDAINSLSKSA